MNRAGKPHPLEMLVEWAAPAILALAAAWAASAAGLPLAASAGSGSIALSIGIVAMRTAGKVPLSRNPGFVPVEFVPSEDSDVLLLEDRLVEPGADSRVVQLFARAEPTPGELVLRISDYLSEQGRPAATEMREAGQQVDAGAALHAALANIRATLR